MFLKENLKLIQKLARQCLEKNILLVAAESCTGGLLSTLLTREAGSSKWFDRGFVTYSNNSKIDSLGVRGETLENFGAVSQEIANEMAKGALKNSEANLSISITGIAGPEGGSLDKPVGTVFFSIANQEKIILEHKGDFKGSRDKIREESVLFVLNELLNLTL
ncbi:CinA family protein [Methylophilaceae bacterium]|jgi:nicotinamide-nucleotide amidase|nr:CinA family protein [Methylophilaceae bacterium]|tara:strand:+ start:280 stop:768 length:489 start_codon:yes stop_codon:yes gene_type:complete